MNMRYGFLFVVLVGLTGCAIAPGHHMQTDLPADGDSTYAASGVKITPITATLVKQLQGLKYREPGKPYVDDAFTDDHTYQYRIGPRDVLAITVWDHPELTIPAGEFRSADAAGHLVADDGTIFYPYVGKVKVTGKTVQEVRQIITRRIATYIANPQLDVRVAAFRSQKVHVVGEVDKPGPQPITDVPLTVVEAINRAGGLSDKADMLNVNLTRDNVVNYIDVLALYEQGDTSQNILLQNGDILNVPDRNLQKVFVLGEVNDPSTLIVHQGRLTLTEAISDVGGVNPRSSNPAKIYVMRSTGTPGKPEIYHLDGKSPDSMVLAERFPLLPRDVVYVETAAITNWARVINQLLPTFRSFDILSAPGGF